MPHRAFRRLSPVCASALAVVLALGAACGGEDKIEISKFVENANEAIKPFDATLKCPDKVDKKTTGFDCTVQGTKTGKTATVRAILVGEGDNRTITAADESAFQTAVGEVAR